MIDARELRSCRTGGACCRQRGPITRKVYPQKFTKRNTESASVSFPSPFPGYSTGIRLPVGQSTLPCDKYHKPNTASHAESSGSNLRRGQRQRPSQLLPELRFVSFRANQRIVVRFRCPQLAIIFEGDNISMTTQGKPESVDLEKREFQLSVFACLAIVILAGGLALLMYPAVFSGRENPPSRAPQIAFYGFCTLSCLLVAYIVDRQITIHRLRYQMAQDRKKSSEALRQASADLLSTMPTFNTFEDRLTMEFRRAAAAELKLSVLVVSINMHAAFSEPGLRLSSLGDAAKGHLQKTARGRFHLYFEVRILWRYSSDDRAIGG